MRVICKSFGGYFKDIEFDCVENNVFTSALNGNRGIDCVSCIGDELMIHVSKGYYPQVHPDGFIWILKDVETIEGVHIEPQQAEVT